MRTLINGKPAAWPQHVKDKWTAALAGRKPRHPDERVTDANYFTPRPHKDAYNRGSREEGFTYTVHNPRNIISGRSVWQTIIKRHDKMGGDYPLQTESEEGDTHAHQAMRAVRELVAAGGGDAYDVRKLWAHLPLGKWRDRRFPAGEEISAQQRRSPSWRPKTAHERERSRATYRYPDGSTLTVHAPSATAKGLRLTPSAQVAESVADALIAQKLREAGSQDSGGWPEHAEYLHGHCHHMAVALHREFGWPLAVLKDDSNSNTVHVYVHHPRNPKRVADVRGVTSRAEMNRFYEFPARHSATHTTVGEEGNLDGSISDLLHYRPRSEEVVQRAMRYVRAHADKFRRMRR